MNSSTRSGLNVVFIDAFRRLINRVRNSGFSNTIRMCSVEAAGFGHSVLSGSVANSNVGCVGWDAQSYNPKPKSVSHNIHRNLPPGAFGLQNFDVITGPVGVRIVDFCYQVVDIFVHINVLVDECKCLWCCPVHCLQCISIIPP